MKQTIHIRWQTVLRKAVLMLPFIALAVLSAVLFPRYTTSFRYHCEVGKPWTYDLVTAEFDFPIYKTSAQLAAEEQQLLETFAPCFTPVVGGQWAADGAVLPIISYEDWHNFAPGSCGKAAPRMEVRINSADPANVPGEILARGMNTMLGYFKNPEATAQTLDKDGWYHTGDLGVMDAEGNIYIRGRIKNMLLGASGQNIYPEEIEDKLNTLPYVSECIVIQKNEKLYALIYPDYEEAEKNGLDENGLNEAMEQNRKELNTMVAAYEQISGFKLYKEEFEKTPKRSIKRFLYENAEI